MAKFTVVKWMGPSQHVWTTRIYTVELNDFLTDVQSVNGIVLGFAEDGD